MPALPRRERVELRGPGGTLEASIETAAETSPAAFGVVCHPHPLYGGTLDNKVVYTIARAFQESGAPTIRFNFRGVGASQGEFGDGIGETEDALAAIAYGRDRWSNAALWLGGFSFGGAVAIRAAGAARPTRLVTVAPAIGRVDLTGAAMPQCSWLIVQGEADELVDAAETSSWAARLEHRPELVVLPGVEHFFHGKLNELRAAIRQFLSK
jgi:uncharacterized protein